MNISSNNKPLEAFFMKENVFHEEMNTKQKIPEELQFQVSEVKDEANQQIKVEPVDYSETLPTEFIDIGFPKVEIKYEPDIKIETHEQSLKQVISSTVKKLPQAFNNISKVALNKTSEVINTSTCDNEPDDDEDLIPAALSSQCRGCGKIFQQLLRHLQPFSYKISPCMKHYDLGEIEDHKKVLGNCAECGICHHKIDASYLAMHMATVHFKTQYTIEIKERQQLYDVSPDSCPWNGCTFELKNKPNCMVKHFQTHFSIVEIMKKYNCDIPGLQEEDSDSDSDVKDVDDVDKDKCTKGKIFCKTCKVLFATNAQGKLQMNKTEANSTCNQCQNPNLGVVCRVCNQNIRSPDYYTMEQKQEHIIRHLDSDKHYQKEQVFDFYCLYARMRGFDMETDVSMENLIFFFSVIKVKALQSLICNKNVLSLLLNTLNLSMNQYSYLQKNMDNLTTEKVPSFACFPCNFLVFEELCDMKTHLKCEEHVDNISHLQESTSLNKYILCSQCSSFFSVDTVDDHTGHIPGGKNLLNVDKKNKIKKDLNIKRKCLEVSANISPPSKVKKCENIVSSEVSYSPLPENDGLSGILDSKCRGCGSIFNRIVKHLQPSKLKYTPCMKHYSSNELEIHKKKLQSIKHMRQDAKGTEYTRCNGAYRSKQIFCRLCKDLFAFKINGSVQLTSLEFRSKCNSCNNPHLGVVCRVCNVLIKSLDQLPVPHKYGPIQKHLDSDNHISKEQVLELYKVYAKIKRFDMEKDMDMNNLRFFLTAISAKTLGGSGAAKNNLSVILNVLDLNRDQFNDLQEHSQTLINVGNPNFLCFSCNFLVYGGIAELEEHAGGEEHLRESERGAQEGGKILSCSQCDIFFSVDQLTEHAGHNLDKFNLSDSNIPDQKIILLPKRVTQSAKRLWNKSY